MSFKVQSHLSPLGTILAADGDGSLAVAKLLQKALKCLQIGAGIFKALKKHVDEFQQNHTLNTVDMKPETLEFLADLLLAQAQEMVVYKAINERMKDIIIAKLSAQTELLYSNLKRKMVTMESKRVFPTGWTLTIAEKQMFYSGLSQYHQATVCHEQMSVGEEIARLQVAKKAFTNVTTLGLTTPYKAKDWRKLIEQALANEDGEWAYVHCLEGQGMWVPGAN